MPLPLQFLANALDCRIFERSLAPANERRLRQMAARTFSQVVTGIEELRRVIGDP